MMIPYNVVLVHRNFFSFDRFFSLLTMCTKIYYNDCEILPMRCECAKNQDSFPDHYVYVGPCRTDIPRRGLLSQRGGHRPDALRQHRILSPLFALLCDRGIDGTFCMDVPAVPQHPSSFESRYPPPVEDRLGSCLHPAPRPGRYVAVGESSHLAAKSGVRILIASLRFFS